MQARVTRRAALQAATALGLTASSARAAVDLGASGASPGKAAQDAAFWSEVRRHYTVTDEIVNLENGYWGVMADPVHARFVELTAMVNRRNSVFARNELGDHLAEVRQRLAGVLRVQPGELVLTRGASEALQLLIGGYNRLEPGDTVLYADLDYDAMIYAMEWLRGRRGVEVVKIDLPEPATHDAVLDAYAQAFAAHPRLKLVLLTHVSHRTGLVPPVREIAALARAHGADVILDAAHSWGQIDFVPDDLGVDFIGFNLHKWIGNPQGAGLIYVRADRLDAIDRHMGDQDWPADDIRGRVHTGTVNMACWLTIPAALDFHEAVGAANKEARVRYLRDLWVAEVRSLPGVEVLTVDDPRMHAGITSFRLTGRTSRDDNVALARRLANEFGIFTTRRGGVARGDCVRVTPALYTTEDDVLRLAAALKKIAAG